MLLLFIAVQIAAATASCVGNSSLSCLQQKIVNAAERINSIPEIPITSWMSLVPNRNKTLPTIFPLPEARLKKDGIWFLLGRALDDFLDTRIVKFSLPEWADASGQSVNVDLGRALTAATGRKRIGGKKGNGMGMLMMGMMGKMALMSLGMIKLKAVKALMIGAIALLLSKIQLFKMLASKKGDARLTPFNMSA
ncbi:uncharacterized protein LOC106666484 [Cimex lectularius]|uniref:Uncharacterized protein n=1 Tax=Cimex lectularius TaxID=79782 RepID=A0A8I6SIY0_CIMLE|nr:uncharacterized protein LOC106666484 [Cimex lectularius]